MRHRRLLGPHHLRCVLGPPRQHHLRCLLGPPRQAVPQPELDGGRADGQPVPREVRPCGCWKEISCSPDSKTNKTETYQYRRGSSPLRLAVCVCWPTLASSGCDFTLDVQGGRCERIFGSGRAAGLVLRWVGVWEGMCLGWCLGGRACSHRRHRAGHYGGWRLNVGPADGRLEAD